MILHGTEIEQTIDREERGRFVKELVLFDVPSPEPVRLAMVRKREASLRPTLAPVLLVHGYGQNRYAWHLPSRSVSNYLARAGFDVFNLDLRGHGRSRHLGAKRPADTADFARYDAIAAIAEVTRLSGGRPVYLVGHSLGGLVSYAAATLVPESVAGIVTIGSPYHFTRGSWALTLAGRAILAVDRRLPLGQGVVPLKAWGETVRVTRRFIESPLFPLPIRGFAPGSMEPHVLAQHMSLAMDSGSITVLRGMFFDAMRARDRSHADHEGGGLGRFARAFERLDLPLLVVAGSRDDLAPPASVEPAVLRSRASDKTYRVFPRGHIDLLVGSDASQTVWPLVEAWLRTRARRSAGG